MAVILCIVTLNTNLGDVDQKHIAYLMLENLFQGDTKVNKRYVSLQQSKKPRGEAGK